MEYHPFRAMNTDILFAAEGETQKVQEGFQLAEEQMRRHEDRFTRFSEQSELSALNHSAGNWFRASSEMFEVIQLAYRCFLDTNGLFNPGVLPALEWAGYDRSMDDLRNQGALEERAFRPVLLTASFGGTRFDTAKQSIRLPLGVRIDLGGIAKGWIAEQAARLLKAYVRSCVVDAGGDLFLIGTPQGSQSWRVALENPFRPENDLAVLNIGPGAVATSTTLKRRWKQGGQERHHLIDPRTALPAETAWVSVTAIAEHAYLAEALAKALLIGGQQRVAELVARYPQVAFITVDHEGKLWGSENSRQYLMVEP